MQPFTLTPNLYSWYLQALLIGSFLDHNDRKKAKFFKRALGKIYRDINMRKFYQSIGANSTNRQRAARLALGLFYRRETRGSNLSHQVSKWVNLGNQKSLTRAALRVLTHYRLLNEETLVKLEKETLYAKDDGLEVVPVKFEFETMLTKTELNDLLKLAREVLHEEEMRRSKPPRKPRTPDTPETKAKKAAAAAARWARARNEVQEPA